MQMMHDRTAPQIQDILPDATVAGAAALPTAHMGQGLFDGHALPPLRPSRRRRLAFPPLLHPGVIRMHPEAAARRARGTAVPPPTGPPRRCGDLDHAAGGTGDRRSAWTPPCGALPIQVQGTFGPRSYWIPGSFETSSSMSAPSNALPRFRTLCTNSKTPGRAGVSLVRGPDGDAAICATATKTLPWYAHALHTTRRHLHRGRIRPVHG